MLTTHHCLAFSAGTIAMPARMAAAITSTWHPAKSLRTASLAMGPLCPQVATVTIK
jgi:hypothetical protein